MPDGLAIDLIVEDRAQLLFVGALLRRLATERGCPISVRTVSARGGRPEVFLQLSNYEANTMVGPQSPADLVVVAVDGNGRSYAASRQEVIERAPRSLASRIAVACPDPYVERWFLADPESFVTAIGAAPRLRARRNRKEDYKVLLAQAVQNAGHEPIGGGIEFASEIVEAMDLFRAGKNDSSLKAFVDDFRGFLLRAGPD